MNLIFRIPSAYTVCYVVAKTPKEALVLLDGNDSAFYDQDYVGWGIEVVGAADMPAGLFVPWTKNRKATDTKSHQSRDGTARRTGDG